MSWGCKHAGPCGWASRRTFVTGDQEWWCDTCERDGWLMSAPGTCDLPAPAAANGGALCAREAGHIGPGLFCTSDRDQAELRDAADVTRSQVEARHDPATQLVPSAPQG